MKRLLLPLLAALALPNAVNAESYNAGVAKIQYPKIQQLVRNAFQFAAMGDFDAACSKITNANTLTVMNFEGLQELFPNKDWFKEKKTTDEFVYKFCILKK